MKTKITLLCFLAFLCFIPKSVAQCVSGGWSPPQIIYPQTGIANQVIDDDSWGDDYARIWSYTNHVYTFSTSISSDFITITNDTGTVVYAYGYAGLTYQPAFNQILRYYVHSNSNCEDDPILTIRTKYMHTSFSSFNPACTAPTASSFTNITSSSVNLSWTAPASIPQDGYDLYVSTSNTTPTLSTDPTYELPNTETSQFISGLTAATTYYYWLRSKCDIGIGNWVYRGSFTTSGSVVSGCNSATHGQFPSYTITPTCSGNGSDTISDESWAGEYCNVNVVANRQYTFQSSVATDYITITNAAGTVSYANGVQPVYWNSGSTTGVIRYYLHSNANCGSENVDRSRYVRCETASGCTPPSNVAVSNVTSNTCKITWTAPIQLPSAGYDLYVTTTSTTPDVNTAPSFVIAQLDTDVSLNVGAGITYYVWLRSNCGPTLGNWISGSNFTTPPALVCNGAVNGLYPDATFTPSCTGSAETIVTNAWAGEFTNVNVTPSKQYTFRSSNTTDFLTITNTNGSVVLASGTTPVVWNSGSTSGVVRFHLNTNSSCGTQNTNRSRTVQCTTVASTCAAPTALSASNITSNSVRLNWTAPATAPSSGYEIYASTINTAPVAGSTPTGTSTVAEIDVLSSLSASTTYYFWVRSNCGAEKGAWVSGGNFATRAALTCNGAVYGLYPNTTFVPVQNGVAQTIATDSWAGEFSNVQINDNGNYVFTSSIATDYITITNADGNAVYASGVTPLSWSAGNSSGIMRFYIHTNANCGAQNSSRTKSVTYNYASATCGAPSALTATNVTSNSVRFTWTLAATVPSLGYDLYFTTSSTAPNANTTPTITNLTAGYFFTTEVNAATTYYYWIRSNCGATRSAWISGGNFTTNPTLACNGASFGLFPESTYTVTNSGNIEQFASSLAGQYSNISVTANKNYVLRSSVATDYITITNAAGTSVLAHGVTPLSWSSGNVSGVVRFFVHSNANCGIDQSLRNKSIQSTDGSLGDTPMTAAPNPTLPQSQVISMFSNVYNNLPVDTWKVSWTPAQVGLTDLQIQGNDTKRYTNLNYVGIEMAQNPINISGMTHINIDVWSPDFQYFGIKLVDLGPNGVFGGGDDVEQEITYYGAFLGQWLTYSLPLSSFEGLFTREHIAQLILSSSNSRIFIDNVYFSNDGVSNNPNSVAIVGEAVGGWPANTQGEVDAHQMSTTDHIHWTYNNLVVSNGNFKFRGNNSWSSPFNWGVNGPQNFNQGTVISGGGDMIGQIGVYDVTFNSTTGAYTFTADQTAFPVLGMVGTATPGIDTDTDMFTNDGVNYWYTGVQLTQGVLKFRHNHMWTTTNNWGGNTFPAGQALLDSDYLLIPTPGNYDVLFSKGSFPFYSFSFAGISLVGSATPGGWPTGTPEEVDPHQMTTTDGVHYALNNIVLTEGALKFRANNAWNRQWGATTFPTGTAYQQIGGDIFVPWTSAGTYNVTFNILTGAFVFSTPLSTGEFDKTTLKVFPNPTKDRWIFISSGESISNITIVDVTGKVVLERSHSGSEATIDGSLLSSGVYIATVTTERGSETVKLVKN